MVDHLFCNVYVEVYRDKMVEFRLAEVIDVGEGDVVVVELLFNQFVENVGLKVFQGALYSEIKGLRPSSLSLHKRLEEQMIL